MLELGHYVYIVKCSDDTFYIGYARDVSKRINEHNTTNKGAKYTRGRRPVKLVFYDSFKTRSEALKYEHALKRKKRSEKEELVNNFDKLAFEGFDLKTSEST